MKLTKSISVWLVQILVPVALAVAGAAPTLHAAPADFTVESPVDGKTFKLSDAAGKYVALHFLLKTECPFCLRHTRDYTQQAAQLPGVVQIFLKPDSADEIKAWAAKVNRNDPGAATVYRDPDARLATDFEVPDGYRFHGQTVHYPALILLDPTGKEVFRYVGKSNSDRLPFDKFAAKVTELTNPPAPALAHYNLGKDRLALQGYDPVNYFTTDKAAKGHAQWTASYRGVTYQFATEENRKLFTAAPEKYVPTYGGWCATAMAKGEKVEIDPENFKVTNGRLFLFYKGLWGNARKDWDKDEPGSVIKADAAWKKISGE